MVETHRVELQGLKSEVLVNFDVHGIPHINAENIADLNFVHGYVKAGERLWQMDYLRRAAAGRLAEILGVELLGEDVDENAKEVFRFVSKCGTIGSG